MDDPLIPVDLAPNQGSDEFWTQDKERLADENRDRAIIASSYPIMPSLIKWFEDSIADCNRIDQLDLIDSGDIAIQVLARREVKRLLEEKFADFKDVNNE